MGGFLDLTHRHWRSRLSLLYLNACGTLLLLFTNYNFDLVFHLQILKKLCLGRRQEKYFENIFSVYFKGKKCVFTSKVHMPGRYVWMNSLALIKWGVFGNDSSQPGRFKRLMDSASQKWPGRGQKSLFTAEETQLDLGQMPYPKSSNYQCQGPDIVQVSWIPRVPWNTNQCNHLAKTKRNEKGTFQNIGWFAQG